MLFLEHVIVRLVGLLSRREKRHRSLLRIGNECSVLRPLAVGCDLR